MDPRFQAHNTHLEDPGLFGDLDPHLRRLKKQSLVHQSELLDRLPRTEPGIYTISGGRQVGKTTLIKQFMARMLAEGADPQSMAYLSGELIDDHHSLVSLISSHLSRQPQPGNQHIFLDEVTYTRDWNRGVKHLSDTGLLDNVILVLTGSDLVILKEAITRLPGRRGRASQVDFHMHPLGFGACVRLKGVFSPEELASIDDPRIQPETGLVDRLFEQFEMYLVHGGFLTAINDMAMHGTIEPATLSIYSDWIRGDMIKRGKQERYLREVVSAVVKRGGSQVTWNSLARDLSIDHPKTVADYIGLLESMDVLFVQAALQEDKLLGSPKKARKVFFTDPFILHAVRHWLGPVDLPFEQTIKPYLEDPEHQAWLAESCAVTHYGRFFPTYYIKAAGEVDIAYVQGKRFWPVEIKWSKHADAKALKQVSKYPNARILDRSSRMRTIHGVPTEPLPLALIRLETRSG